MKIALAHFLVNEQLPQFFIACFHAFHLSKVCRINLAYIIAQAGLLFNIVSYTSGEYDRFAGITQHLSAILVVIRENACAVFARHRRSLSFYLIISFLFFLEDSELGFMLVTLAVDKPDPLLNTHSASPFHVTGDL